MPNTALSRLAGTSIGTISEEKKMRVIILGATGTIEREIMRFMEPRHYLVGVGFRSGEIRVDYTEKKSVQTMYE